MRDAGKYEELTVPEGPSPFDRDAISQETEAINRAIIDQLQDYDPWAQPIAETRAMRAAGGGPFPVPPHSERAVTHEIEGPGGLLQLRIVAPESPRGAYLHLHGGGWVLGTADGQDPRLERLADACGLAAVSVNYRLAPEHPFPAAPDDCEAAALWLVEEAPRRFGTDRLFIGGESAGAHLSAITLLRLRDRHGLTPFAGADLISGIYDLTLTPSARNWGSEKLILTTADVERFIAHFLEDRAAPDGPDVSPLYADLAGLPPALITVGTRDPLLDDSLFMAQRWRAAGNRAELAVYPGGAHVFLAFAGRLARQGAARIDAFLNNA
ncbi:MAG: alpha/beta hydrolase [Methyloligellaceae bacterium]